MKLLIDNALSSLLAEKLQGAGYDAVHVRELGMQAASDEVSFAHAFAEGRTIVSADTDFGTILARQKTAKPSFILFRHGTTRVPELQARLLIENLPRLEEDIELGSIVVFVRDRIRIRRLPLGI